MALESFFIPLSANPTKWSNTLKQFVGNLPTNCFSVFDRFVELALNGLLIKSIYILTKYDCTISGINQQKLFSYWLHPLKNNFGHTIAFNLCLIICFNLKKNRVLFSRYLHLCSWWIHKLQILWSHHRP